MRRGRERPRCCAPGTAPVRAWAERASAGIVVAEVAVSLVMPQWRRCAREDFIRVQDVAPGFTARDVLTGQSPPVIDYPIVRGQGPSGPRSFTISRSRADDSESRPRRQSRFPTLGSLESTSFSIDGRPPCPGRAREAQYAVVTPTIRAMGSRCGKVAGSPRRSRRCPAGDVIRSDGGGNWPNESAIASASASSARRRRQSSGAS